MLNYDTSSSYLWDKMIRREFWLAAQAFSPEGLSYSEDWFVLIQLYFHACKIVKVNRAFYHYTRSNVNSITHKVTSKHFENMVTLWGLIDGFLVKEGCAGRYRSLVEQSKVVMKMGLMFKASYGLKRNYAPLFYGKVVDMFYFPIIRTTWPDWMPIWGGESFVFFSPVFNFADAAISCGIIALLLFYHKRINL